MDAAALETFAGTAKQASQRLVSSEVACRPDWVYVAVDVVKAFLRGMTNAAMHELTGEAPREVNFTLPPGSAAILRQVPGYETFDERTECLHCIKPGTGCKDAPRAFSLKLARATRSPECNAKPATWGPELEVKHVATGSDATSTTRATGGDATRTRCSDLVLLPSKRVGDLNIA